jgi:hypothetical protein
MVALNQDGVDFKSSYRFLAHLVGYLIIFFNASWKESIMFKIFIWIFLNLTEWPQNGQFFWLFSWITDFGNALKRYLQKKLIFKDEAHLGIQNITKL